MDVQWRGRGDNPHPFKGTNEGGVPVSPTQMEPSATCSLQSNVEEYMSYATANVRPK